MKELILHASDEAKSLVVPTSWVTKMAIRTQEKLGGGISDCP